MSERPLLFIAYAWLILAPAWALLKPRPRRPQITFRVGRPPGQNPKAAA